MSPDHLHFAARFRTIAEATPHRPCLIHGDEHLTFAQVNARADALANALLKGGLRRGDRVAVMERNSSAYVIACIAAMKLACVPFNVNYRYRADELAYLLRDAGATALVIRDEFLEVLEGARAKGPGPNLVVVIGRALAGGGMREYDRILDEESRRLELPWAPPGNDDLLFLLYTGGTTGYPKGVMWDGLMFEQLPAFVLPLVENILQRMARAPSAVLAPDTRRLFNRVLGRVVDLPLPRWALGNPLTQRAILKAVETSLQARFSGSLRTLALTMKVGGRLVPVRPVLVASPLMHGSGWLMAVMALAGGQPLLLMQSRGFDPHEVWRAVEREQPRCMVIVGDAFAVPLLDALNERDYDTASLRLINSAGVVWSPDVKKRLLEHMPQLIVLDTLGASEGVAQAEPTLSSEDAPRAMQFRMSEHIKVFDDADREIRPGSGRVGQLAMSGFIPRGYWNDAEKTGRTFRTIRGVRYAMIGDMCRVNADGTLTFLGRGSGLINTGGEKVFPEEVENVIKQLPEIADCAVVGVPDKRFGEVVAAVVTAAPGRKVSTEAVIEHCNRHLAGYKKPRTVHVVDQVPRQDNGKLAYSEIRRMVTRRMKREASS